MTKELVVKI